MPRHSFQLQACRDAWVGHSAYSGAPAWRCVHGRSSGRAVEQGQCSTPHPLRVLPRRPIAWRRSSPAEVRVSGRAKLSLGYTHSSVKTGFGLRVQLFPSDVAAAAEGGDRPELPQRNRGGVSVAFTQRVAAQDLVHVVVHHDAERRRECLPNHGVLSQRRSLTVRQNIPYFQPDDRPYLLRSRYRGTGSAGLGPYKGPVSRSALFLQGL